MKKRLLAALLAACLALTPMAALAAGSGSDTSDETLTEEERALAERRERDMNRLLWFGWIFQRYAPMPFEDVPSGSWYYPGICYSWQNGLMSGVSDSSFAPMEPTTRAMVWTVLARINRVSVQGEAGMEWYEPGAAWAVRQGLTDGADPMGAITREALVEMLWKQVGGPLTQGDLSGFSDSGTVSAYAENAVRWAVNEGLLCGSDGQLSPQGSVTRAELAAIVMRYASDVRYREPR